MRAADWAFVRGTSTRQPNSGLFSNHSVSWAAAASPITTVTGASSSSSNRPGVNRPNVVRRVCCRVVVPLTVAMTT